MLGVTILAISCGAPRVVRETIAPDVVLRRYVALVRARRPDEIYLLLGGRLRERFSRDSFRLYFRDYYTLIRAEAESIRRRLDMGQTPRTHARIRLASRSLRFVYEDGGWRLADDPTKAPAGSLSSDPRAALAQVARWLKSGRLFGPVKPLAPEVQGRVQRGTRALLTMIDARLARGTFSKGIKRLVIGRSAGPYLELVLTASGYRVRRIRIPGGIEIQ